MLYQKYTLSTQPIFHASFNYLWAGEFEDEILFLRSSPSGAEVFSGGVILNGNYYADISTIDVDVNFPGAYGSADSMSLWLYVNQNEDTTQSILVDTNNITIIDNDDGTFQIDFNSEMSPTMDTGRWHFVCYDGISWNIEELELDEETPGAEGIRAKLQHLTLWNRSLTSDEVENLFSVGTQGLLFASVEDSSIIDIEDTNNESLTADWYIVGA